MGINTIYDICKSLANKYNRGYFSPVEFNNYFNLASTQLFESLIGSYKDYQARYPLPVYGKMFNQTMQEKLSPFFVKVQKGTNATFALVKPSDFSTIVNVLDVNRVRIDIVAANKIDTRLSDGIDVVTTDKPIVVDEGNYYQMYPVSGYSSLPKLWLYYYKKPNTYKWGYNVVNNAPVYDSSLSVQPEWRDEEIPELIGKTLSFVGISVQQNDIINYSQIIEKQ